MVGGKRLPIILYSGIYKVGWGFVGVTFACSPFDFNINIYFYIHSSVATKKKNIIINR